jgi:acyl carrier protein
MLIKNFLLEAKRHMETSSIVKKYIIDNFLFEDEGFLTSEVSLLEHGVIDSTGIFEIATFLEEKFEIKIEDHEFVPENLDSLANIDRFIKMKLTALRPEKEVKSNIGYRLTSKNVVIAG